MAVKHQTHFCSLISNKEMQVGNMEVKQAPASDCFVRVFFHFLTYNLHIVFICSVSVKMDDAVSITFEFCRIHSVLTSPRSWVNLIQGLEMFTFTSMFSLCFCLCFTWDWNYGCPSTSTTSFLKIILFQALKVTSEVLQYPTCFCRLDRNFQINSQLF